MAERINEENESEDGEGDDAPGEVVDVGAINNYEYCRKEIDEGAGDEDPDQESHENQERNGVVGWGAEASKHIA